MQRIAKFFARYAAADMSLLTYSRRQSYNKVLKLTNNWKGNVRICAAIPILQVYGFHELHHLIFVGDFLGKQVSTAKRREVALLCHTTRLAPTTPMTKQATWLIPQR